MQVRFRDLALLSFASALTACAAISGLDGLEVRPDPVTGGGDATSDGMLPGDGSQGSDGAGVPDGPTADGATPDGATPDASGSDSGRSDGAPDTGKDTGPADTGPVDSGVDPGIVCGNGAHCTGTDVCCLGPATPTCGTTAACGGNPFVSCDTKRECPAAKFCCAAWGATANNSTSCEDSCAAALTLCQVADPGACPSGKSCTGTYVTHGITYGFCQ